MENWSKGEERTRQNNKRNRAMGSNNSPGIPEREGGDIRNRTMESNNSPGIPEREGGDIRYRTMESNNSPGIPEREGETSEVPGLLQAWFGEVLEKMK